MPGENSGGIDWECFDCTQDAIQVNGRWYHYVPDHPELYTPIRGVVRNGELKTVIRKGSNARKATGTTEANPTVGKIDEGANERARQRSGISKPTMATSRATRKRVAGTVEGAASLNRAGSTARGELGFKNPRASGNTRDHSSNGKRGWRS